MKLTKIFFIVLNHLQFASFRSTLIFLLFGGLVIIFSSCSTTPTLSPSTLATSDISSKPTVTLTAALTKTPISVSQRHGGWLDEIDFSVIDTNSAIAQLKAGEIDIYANGLDSSEFPTIKDAGLKYTQHNGKSYAIMFNPAIFTDNTTLNPFANRKIREAMNWLVDRAYINQSIYAGGSLPKLFAIQTNGPDYADLGDVVRKLESKYTYSLETGKKIVTTEMQGMGAILKDAKWFYKDKPVALIFIIRNDDNVRKQIGDYVAIQLEKIGFTVDRQYGNAAFASKARLGPPAEGVWNLYTPVWISTAINRDEKYSFQSMYLASSTQNSQPFLSNTKADPEFKKLADDLATANFSNLATRRQMMAHALELSLQDSLQVWLIDGKTFSPYSPKLNVTYDLAAGVEIAQIWPYTLRFYDKEGGQLKWATQDLFSNPWNPIAGTNFDYDWGAINATQSSGLMSDPYTGLTHPLRIERAELVAQEGLPITKTLDWVKLTFEKEIKIPDDTLVDWDAENQVFITAKQIAPKIAEAKEVVKAYKSKDADISPKLKAKAIELAAKLQLTPINAVSVQGFMKELATSFKQLGGDDIDVVSILDSDNGKTALNDLIKVLNATKVTETPALKNDEKAARLIDFALSYIKVAAPDEDTLSLASRDYISAKTKSIVYYPADLFDKVKWHDGSKLSVADFLMGTIMVFDRAKPKSSIYDSSATPSFYAFMSSFKGFKVISLQPLVIEYYSDAYAQDAELNISTLWPAYPWHEITISNFAEANSELAYSSDKADQKKIEWLSLIGGPSIPILTKYLDKALSENYIPYSATLGQYITADAAKTRYENLKSFAGDHSHYWVGTGPYILDKVFLTSKSLVLKNNSEYPDIAGRWSVFGEPKIPHVVLDGTSPAKIGTDVAFNISVTFKGQPYSASDINTVKYLLFNAKNEVVSAGDATPILDGQYKIVLPADFTAKLEVGSNRIEVVVTTFPVSVPTFVSFEFVTAK